MLATIGFPCSRHERGEVREFLPTLIDFLTQFPLTAVVLEDGYGARMGLSADAYQRPGVPVRFGTREEAFGQQLVVTLRCPPADDLRALKRGAFLLSMLHFPTRPSRVTALEAAGVIGVAMDQIVDDLGRRLVENLEAVATNGIRVGMEQLARTWPEFARPGRRPLQVVVLGAGAVGGWAVRAAVRYGAEDVRRSLRTVGAHGVAVTALDVEACEDESFVDRLLSHTDLLVDATARVDASRPIISTARLARLPAHAVLVDLAVDPVDRHHAPPLVKALEGIPQGNLDQFVFTPEDPAWDAAVPLASRRTVASCYSWPGIQPRACMEVYGKQLEPIVRALITRGADLPVVGGVWAERATGRGLHRRWLEGAR